MGTHETDGAWVRDLALRLVLLLVLAAAVVAVGVASVPTDALAAESTASECYPPGPECDTTPPPTSGILCNEVTQDNPGGTCDPAPACTDCLPSTGVDTRSMLLLGVALAGSGLLAVTVVRRTGRRRG